jgi:CRP-like cAMP-binding protein
VETTLTADELAEVAGLAEEVSVPAGHELTREGEPGREFLVIVEGAATVVRDGEAVATLGPGDFLGEIALLVRAPRTATVTTTEPTRLLVFDDRAFRELTERIPSLASRAWAATAARY